MVCGIIEAGLVIIKEQAAMGSIVLKKIDVIDILNNLKQNLTTKHSTDAGARILLIIGKILTDIECCIKNIEYFSNVQRRIICLIEDVFKILGEDDKEQIQTIVRKLNASISELDEISIKEIKGENCLQEFVNLGFEGNAYNSEYY